MSWLDSWRNPSVLQMRYRGRKVAVRMPRRTWPRFDLLEDRVTPSNVLQTDIPLLPNVPFHGGGYTATRLPGHSFEDISDAGAVAVLGDLDDSFAEAPIGFDFTFFGNRYSSLFVTSNGLISFRSLPDDSGYTDYTNTNLTSNSGPNRPIIAVLWDDWITRVSEADKLYYKTLGSPGDQRFIVQWDQVSGYSSSPSTVTFQAVLFENDASIQFRYQDVIAGNGEDDHLRDFGRDATIGIRSGFPGVTSETQYADGEGEGEGEGEGDLPDDVFGIQVGFNGGSDHVQVVNNNTTIAFVPDELPLPANHPPTDIELNHASVNENAPVGSAVGTFTSVDVDNPDDSHTYHLVSGFSPNDNAQFLIAGNELRTASVFNFEARHQYAIRVETRDSQDAVFQREFTIDIGNVNEPPTSLSLSSANVGENSPVGTTIGTFATGDPDNPDDTHTYHLIAGAGPNDNALFTISGNQLKTNAVFNFELRQEYVVRVETRDLESVALAQGFTIHIVDLNEPPTDMALSSAHVEENRPSGSVVGTFSTADDDNPADHHNYSLVASVGAADNALFTIDGDQLKSNVAFNFELRRDYSILVESRDRENVAFQKHFAIHIDDVNEAPTILAGQHFSVAEGSSSGTFVGTVVASDPDTLQVPLSQITYSIESSLFSINSATGHLSVAEGAVLNFETNPVLVVDVRVADNGVPGLFTLVPVTINVTNVAPTAEIHGVPLNLLEGALLELNSVVTDPGDPIGGQHFVYSWSITRNAAPIFAGFVSPTNGPSFAFKPENNGVYVITLVVADEGDASVTTPTAILVVNVRPVTDAGRELTFTGPNSTFARTIGFTDPGADHWSVTVNYGDGASESFDLTPGNHGYNPIAKTFTIQHSYAAATTFTVSVTVTDSDEGKGPASFPVTVFTAREITRVTGFAIAVVDESGTAQSELAAVDGTARLNATLTNGKPGDNVSLTLYKSDPVLDRVVGEDQGPTTRIPIQGSGDTAGTALPLAFVDTRCITGDQATCTLVYEFVVPDSVATSGLRLFWWNAPRKIWQNVSGQDENGDSVEVIPILDAAGNRTGNSLVRLTKTYGPNSHPSMSELTGTVFSIAVPVGGGGSSTVTINLPANLARNGPASDTSISVRTTGFGSGSNLLLSLQESQTSSSLLGQGGLNSSIGGVGEYDIAASGTSEQLLLNWLLDGELWRDRRPSNPGTDPRDPSSTDQQRSAVGTGGGGEKQEVTTAKARSSTKRAAAPKGLNEITIRRMFASPSGLDEVAEAAVLSRRRQSDYGLQRALAIAAVMASAAPKPPLRNRRLAKKTTARAKSA